MFGPEYTSPAEIGRGRFSTVYRARSAASGHDVVLKLFPRKLTDPNLLAELDQECATIEALSAHRNVAKVHGWSQVDDDRPYVVMQSFALGSLADVVRRDGPLPPGEVLSVAASIGSALSAAHASGIAHGNVTPKNILATAGGDVALADFVSLAPGRDGESLADHAFAAPEVARGGGPTGAGDTFSLAATLSWLLTAGSDAATEAIPPFMGAAIQSGLAASPAERPSDIMVFVETLLASAHAEGIESARSLAGHVAPRDGGTAAATAVAAPEAAESAQPVDVPEPEPESMNVPEPEPESMTEPEPEPESMTEPEPMTVSRATPRPANADQASRPRRRQSGAVSVDVSSRPSRRAEPEPKQRRTSPVAAAALAVTLVIVVAVAIFAHDAIKGDTGKVGAQAPGPATSPATTPAITSPTADPSVTTTGVSAVDPTVEPSAEPSVAVAKQVAIPQVAGMSATRAAELLQAAGFRVKVTSRSVDSRYPAGRVAYTIPSATDLAPEGSTVQLRLSGTTSQPVPTATALASDQ